jgi:hypothetical protein
MSTGQNPGATPPETDVRSPIGVDVARDAHRENGLTPLIGGYLSQALGAALGGRGQASASGWQSPAGEIDGG